MTLVAKELWSLVLNQIYVDPDELAAAIEDQSAEDPLDYRTRLLIRDGVEALRAHWRKPRFEAWLAQCPSRDRIEAIDRESFDGPGFPFLKEQLVEPTKPETIEQLLREVGDRLQRPVQIEIGGSGALILSGHLSRRTQDLDVVDELPRDIRALGNFLDELEQRYRLRIAHFQSHYLPAGWKQRVHSRGPYGRLQASLVDVHDIFLSKLFSARDKDRDDLRMLVPQLPKETIVRRLQRSAAALLKDDIMRPRAEKNWYILFGEPLPSGPEQGPSSPT